jgi:probable rRNA maturation factor
LGVTLTIEVIDQTGRLKASALGWLTEQVEKAVRHLGALGEVRVRVIDDAEMAAAHEEFAGVAGTTDVLTFDLTDPETSPGPRIDLQQGRLESDGAKYGLDTDILACLAFAERQVAYGDPETGGFDSVERELLLYVVHGVLHCLGMDDHDEDAAAAMHRVEDVVLTAIGVGPVYSGREPGRGASG